MIPSVYSYLDYRQYLYDLYNAMKQAEQRFSCRKFSRLAGSTSPNFLQLICDRKLRIQPAGAQSLAEAIKLEEKERIYLETIIAFDHARTHEEKDKWFRCILATREYSAIKQIEKNQYNYFSHWYIPVIRELVTSPDYTDNPSWIADRITPPVSENKVRNGIELLRSMGFIKRNEHDGRWVHTDSVISTPSEVLSVAVAKYHRDSISLGRDAIDRFPASQRDIRSVTLGLTEEGFNEVKTRIEAFWKELLSFSETQSRPDSVCQVNIQMFPLTGKKGKRRRV